MILSGDHCHLHKVIIDSKCNLPAGLAIGLNPEDDIANGFRVSAKGVTLVTQEMLNNYAKQQSENTVATNIRQSIVA